MDYQVSDGTVTIKLEGSIDAAKAGPVEDEINAILDQCDVESVVFDMRDLDYISSAGLRVLMRMLRRFGSLKATNVNSEVYDVFDMTGFTEMMDVTRAARQISVEGCELIGKGGNGEVYRLDDDTIVKVYKPWMSREEVDRERSFARTAFVNGVPSVIAYDVVEVGDCYGLVFEMIRSDTLGHVLMSDPEHYMDYIDKYVELARTLHSTKVAPGTFDRIQSVLHGYADKLGEWCTDAEIATLHEIIDCMPESETLTHNDLHPGNIMVQDGELVLIDMPDVTTAPPICDLVSIYRDMIVAPSGANKDSIEQSVGMPAEEVIKVGNLFFMKYTGITDPDQLKAFYEKLGLIYAMNVALICGSGAERARQLAPMLMDKLLRGVVLPNKDALKYLLSNL